MSSRSSSVIAYEEVYNTSDDFHAKYVDLNKDIQEIQKKMNRIQLTDRTEKASRKMRVLQEAFLELVNIQQRVTLTRLDMRLSDIDAEFDQRKLDASTEPATGITNLNFPGFSQSYQLQLQTVINNLQTLPPVMRKRDVIPLSERVAYIVKVLSGADASYLKDEMFVNMVFVQFIDVFQIEWFEFLREYNVQQVDLQILVEFLDQMSMKVTTSASE